MMVFLKICLLLVLLATTMVFLTNCTSTPPEVQQYSATANPSEEIANLEYNLEKAKSEQVHVLSPNHFVRAEKSLKKAKEARSDRDGNMEILKHVAIGNAWLVKANDTAERASDTIPDIVDVRARALEAKASVAAKDSLQDADYHLKKMSREFEKGDYNISNKDRKDLLNEYLAVELSAIKADRLAPAHANIKRAEKEGAQTSAPQTLALARKKYKDAEAFITANRQDVIGIDRVTGEALAEAERVLRISREARVNKNKTPEQLALEMEREKKSQIQLSQELEAAKSQIGQSESALAVMSAQTSQLSEKIALDEKIQVAKEQFDDSEAEVLRDGDKLLIRLKGLRFPSGQTDIAAGSYPLMTKVQTIIRSIGPSDIEIEGHTDAIGSKDLNAKLSEKRAEAVKNYLVENGVTESSSISSTGYGDEKPITSNKTREGREQNRRVDIIISPM